MNLQAYLDIQPEIKAAVEAGKPVVALHRLSMGPLALDGGLAPGNWRFLTERETAQLKSLGGRP